MSSPSDRYQAVRTEIEDFERKYGRNRGAVRLLAASKQQSAANILAIAQAGQTHFGENYLDEAVGKIAELAPHGFEWHFIGRVQSNKTRAIAAQFDWVHSVDRLKIARRLHEQRPADLDRLNICIEVNISAEQGKGGIDVEELPAFIDALQAFERLRIRGLMALPAPSSDFEVQRASFRALARARAAIDLPDFDTLSMGTSQDFEAAIAEGATMVRIGTALFGPRS